MHPRSLAPIALALVVAVAAGCRSEMYDQPRFEPLEGSDFFADGQSARPLVPGTVARTDPRNEPRDVDYDHFHLGMDGDEVADTLPFPVDEPVLARGRERYMIFCSPCHGALGDGNGMIVQRGFSPPPPLYGPRPRPEAGSTPVTLYDDLRRAPVGHFYRVITNGHGAMYSYASRISPEDRWKIAAYIRALQLSQYATPDDLRAIPEPNDQERELLQEASR